MKRYALAALAALAALCLAEAAAASAEPRALRVGLHARWPATPTAAEAGEWLSGHGGGADVFWRYIDLLAAGGGDGGGERGAVDLAAGVLGAGGAAALRWAVAARVMSPRVRVHAALGEEVRAVAGGTGGGAGGFAVVFGNGSSAGLVKVVGVAEAVGGAVAGECEEGVGGWVRLGEGDAEAVAVDLPYDHVFAGDGCVGGAGRRRVVWYAEVGDGFAEWHTALKGMAVGCEVEYVLRWGAGGSKGVEGVEPGLQGYVVEVALKSTEYKVQDDVVFGVELFPNCPHGAAEGTCAAKRVDGGLGEAEEPEVEVVTKDGEDEAVHVGFEDQVDFEDDEPVDVGRGKLIEGLDGYRHTELLDIDGMRSKSDAALVAAEHVLGAAAGDAAAAVGLARRFAEDLPIALAVAYAAREAIGQDKESSGVAVRKEAKRRLARLRKAATAVRSLPGLAEVVYFNGRRILASELTEDLSRPLACLAGISRVGDELRRVEGLAQFVPQVLRTEPKEGTRKLRVDTTVGGRYHDVFRWFNDLAKDSRYAEWPGFDGDGVSEFADNALADFDPNDYASERARSGGLVSVRGNLVSLVLAVDLGNIEHAPYLGAVDSIVRGMIPIRVAMVAVPGDRISTLWASMFYYCLDVGGLKLATQLLATLRQMLEYFASGAMQSMPANDDLVEIVYQQLRQDSNGGGLKILPVADIVEQSDSVREHLVRVHKWAIKLGIITSDPNGKPWDPEAVVAEVPREVTDGVSAKVDDGSTSFDIVGILNGIVLKDIGTDAMALALSEQQRIGALLKSGDLSVPSDSSKDTVAHWISADPSLLVVSKLDAKVPSSSGAKAGDVPQQEVEVDAKSPSRPQIPLSALVTSPAQQALRSETYEAAPTKTMAVVTVWLLIDASADAKDVKLAEEKFAGMLEEDFAERSGARAARLGDESALASLLRSVDAVRGSPASALFIVNGIVYTQEQVPSSSDLELLVAKEAGSFGTSAREAVGGNTASADSVLLATLAMREGDGACGTPDRASDKIIAWGRLMELLDGPEDQRNMLLVKAARDAESSDVSEPRSSADIQLSVVVDPVGKQAVFVMTLVEAIVSAFGSDNVEVQMLLVPAPQLPSDGPGTLRAVFSRAVFGAEPVYEQNSGRILPAAALFPNLPQEALLTVGMVTPRAWFVAPSATGYDLDNVVLRNLDMYVSTLHAEFAMESLIVEGSCIDETGTPPQGLRLEMTNRPPLQVDTLVMSNLGYFQLKTPSPGRWHLDIAAGRGRDIFDIVSVSTRSGVYGASSSSGTSPSKFSSNAAGQIYVLVDSFNGARNTILRVKRKPGMEDVPLLDPQLAGKRKKRGGRVSKLWKTVSGSRDADNDETGLNGKKGALAFDNRIHVFSVASGHLYERFLKIMMLSVTKHASVPVKFWLLENYLSPTFKKVIPHFAAEHDFEVEMVTYRWPSWLREQAEKQRIIWAYKILFLDVLFPLNLHRVVFVDSDQVVRGDLAELMSMDLKGAPYAYTPFCDSRKEVDGFRFWKTGFWKDALKGAKYRISALYVVDLDIFRETSAGDTLRFVYQSLSSDPNSLSNLDQDLPNYASVVPMGTLNTVPIFDLPQEWLWCESWCDDESKAAAKTIDLCNNPMTKEPKLESAKRIVPEWVDLDAEAFRTSSGVHQRLASKREEDGRYLAGTDDGDSGSEAQDDVAQKDEL